MSKIQMKKKLDIIGLYFEGQSYEEISTKTHTSKGSVSNIITELKAGKFPEYYDLSEQMDVLRELANELKNNCQIPQDSW